MRGCKPHHQKLTVLLLAAASLACAPAPRMGEAVDIAEESAIIIWDEAAKTQHFIRRASFRTTAKDFGFLVPTPTVPELADADDKAFSILEKLTEPRTIVQVVPTSAKFEPAPAAAPLVTVVSRAKVAGYDAVVLEASDAAALNNWLKEHGYASTPELVEWFRPYLERKWKISAFKVDRDAQNMNAASSGTVRMSFRTEAPFFPYREPAGMPGGSAKIEPRMLRTYVLAASRMDGILGDAGAWPGRVVWSDQISAKDRETLLAHANLPPSAAPGALRLSEFEDASSPRPGGDDVFFRPAADQAPVHRPDVIVYETDKSFFGNLGYYAILGIYLGLIVTFFYAIWKLVAFAIRKVRS